MSRVWRLQDESATQRLGAALARHCPWQMPGARCLFLSGELGAGKTSLAAAVLAALGVQESVRSPTYALLETYPLGAHLGVHVDLYRLQAPAELEQLGLRDYLHPDALLLVEWPERALDYLPRPDLWVRLSSADPGRRCAIETHTPAGDDWLGQLSATHPASEDI